MIATRADTATTAPPDGTVFARRRCGMAAVVGHRPGRAASARSTTTTPATGFQLAPASMLAKWLSDDFSSNWSGRERSDGPRVCMAIVEFARPSHLAKELVSREPAVACAAPPRRNLVWWWLLRLTIRQRLGL